MAAIVKFEDIEAWRLARNFVRQIYQLTDKDELARDFGLKDQIRRASVSIMSNIAEGFERGGDREFKQYLFISKASAGEVRSLLYVLLDAGRIPKERFDLLNNDVIQIGKLLSGFIKYLERKL